MLHDPDLAEAILDRVLERGRLIELRGPSYRTRHLKAELRGGRGAAAPKSQAEPSPAPQRDESRPRPVSSGKGVPDFPEPTLLTAEERAKIVIPVRFEVEDERQDKAAPLPPIDAHPK